MLFVRIVILGALLSLIPAAAATNLASTPPAAPPPPAANAQQKGRLAPSQPFVSAPTKQPGGTTSPEYKSAGFWVAFFTALATGATAFFSLRVTRAAEKSSEAAKQAIVGLDRPYLMVGNPARDDGKLGIHGAKFTLSNFGRSPAAASKLIEALVEQSRQAPPELPADGCEVHQLDGIFIAPAASHALDAKSTTTITGGLPAVLGGEKRLIWMGQLDYADVMGHGYRTTFCYELTARGWQMAGGNALNQSRQLDA